MIKTQIRIGNIELKNRLIMPPVATYLSTDDGKVTDRLIEYYGERAKGGSIGMIITEHCYISQQGKAKAKQLSIANDDDVEGLTRLVNTIHQNGTKAMAQLNHAGATTLESLTGTRKVSASASPLPMEGSPLNEVLPEALTPEGISEIVDDFVRAAVRAKAAGYDVSAGSSVDLTAYTDGANVADYAAEAMRWAIAVGLVNGYEDNTLRPRNTATRAEVAAIMQRMVQNAVK